MLKNILIVVCALALVRAQIPSLGFCPEYVPMANFDMNKFLGVWYEAERYFQITEVVSRCVTANYTKGPDGKLRVSNQVTNRFTGIKRILEGEIKPAASKAEEGKLHVKYNSVPLTPETQYAVLETDYKNYAVLWSCSGLGLVNTQNAWLMTRARRPSGEVMQMAYGVLDKYKISKTFFVKSDQEDCAFLDEAPEAPLVAEPATENPENPMEEPQTAENNHLRSAITPDAPSVIVETRKIELAQAQGQKPAIEISEAEKSNENLNEKLPLAEPLIAAAEEPKENIVQSNEPAPLTKSTSGEPAALPAVPVAQVILQTADKTKETLSEDQREVSTPENDKEPSRNPFADAIISASDQANQVIKDTVTGVQNFNPFDKFKESFKKPLESVQQTFEKPVKVIRETFENLIETPKKKITDAFKKPVDKIKEILHIKPDGAEAPETTAGESATEPIPVDSNPVTENPPPNEEKPVETNPPPKEEKPMEANPPPKEEKPVEANPPPKEEKPMEANPPPKEEKPVEANPPPKEEKPVEANPPPKEEKPSAH